MPEILPIYFAPLQGYTEAVYRNAHAAIFGGIKSYYTPFLRFERGCFVTKISETSNRKTMKYPD